MVWLNRCYSLEILRLEGKKARETKAGRNWDEAKGERENIAVIPTGGKGAR